MFPVLSGSQQQFRLLRAAGEDSKTEHDAYTVDISSKGARIRTVFVLSPGQMVGIVLAGDSRGAMTSRVVWVERSSVVGSLAGLEFLDTMQA